MNRVAPRPPQRPILFVLHGFNSSGATPKASYLRRQLPQFEVRSPTYSHDPHDAVARLRQAAREARALSGRSPCFLGTSLGAFYARLLAREHAARAVLLNPVIDPLRTLEPALGDNTNFRTRESYVFERRHLDAYTVYRIDDRLPDSPTLVLLDLGDELLDARSTARYFAGRQGVEVVSFAGGDHRFAHLAQASPAIRRHLLGR